MKYDFQIKKLGGGVNMIIFFILLFPTLVYGADKVEIVNRIGADQVAIAGDKIDVSTISAFQFVSSGTMLLNIPAEHRTTGLSISSAGLREVFGVTSSSFNVFNSSRVVLNTNKVQIGAENTHTENARFVISAENDHMIIEETDGAVDNKKWLIKGTSGDLEFLTADDAWATWNLFVRFARTGNTVESMQMGAATIGLWQVSGATMRGTTPLRTGELIFNTDDLDVYVSTGTGVGAFKNARTNGAP